VAIGDAERGYGCSWSKRFVCGSGCQRVNWSDDLSLQVSSDSRSPAELTADACSCVLVSRERRFDKGCERPTSSRNRSAIDLMSEISGTEARLIGRVPQAATDNPRSASHRNASNRTACRCRQ